MLIYRTSLNSFHLHIYEKKIKQELVYQAIIINNKVAIKPEELATAILSDCELTELKNQNEQLINEPLCIFPCYPYI